MSDKIRHKLNAPGPWYCTDPSDPSGEGCIVCGLCPSAAPEFFREDEEGYAYVWKQPVTDAEIALCEEQRQDCPVNSIDKNS